MAPKTRTGLAPLFVVGGVLFVIGLLIAGNSTDFDPTGFYGDTTNETGQLIGALTAATGVLVVAIAVAAAVIVRKRRAADAQSAAVMPQR